MAYRKGSPDIMAGKYHVLISMVDIEQPLRKQALSPGGKEDRPNMGILRRVLADAQSGPVPRSELLEQIDRNQVVPALYNRQSNLKYEVVASPGILRTKFDLSKVDPLLSRK